jgi:phage baseplate assembly protein W
MTTNLQYPYGFDAGGRTATSSAEQNARDLIEQVLFTMPGERVMKPDLGSNISQLVFAGNSTELAGTTQMLIQSALHRWLSNIIAVDEVSVQAGDQLTITVKYHLLSTGQAQVQNFSRSGGGF